MNAPHTARHTYHWMINKFTASFIWRSNINARIVMNTPVVLTEDRDRFLEFWFGIESRVSAIFNMLLYKMETGELSMYELAEHWSGYRDRPAEDTLRAFVSLFWALFYARNHDIKQVRR